MSEKQVYLVCRPHVNVVQFLGITEAPICIVTEFMDKGNLHQFIREYSTFLHHVILRQTHSGKTWAIITSYMVKGIAAGMLHLHSEKIIHRNLTSKNVLVIIM